MVARLPFTTLNNHSSTGFGEDLIIEDGIITPDSIIPSDKDIDYWNPQVERRGLLISNNECRGLGQNLHLTQDGKLSSGYFDAIESEEVFGRYEELFLKNNSISNLKIQWIPYGTLLPGTLSIDEDRSGLSGSGLLDREDGEEIVYRQKDTIKINNGVLELSDREEFLPSPNINRLFIINDSSESEELTPSTAYIITSSCNSSVTIPFNQNVFSEGDIVSISNSSSHNIFLQAKVLGREKFQIKLGEVYRLLYVGEGFFLVLKTFSLFSITDQSYSSYRPENPNFAAGFSQIKLTKDGIKLKGKLKDNQRLNIYDEETGEELTDEEKEEIGLDDSFGGGGGGGGSGGGGGGSGGGGGGASELNMGGFGGGWGPGVEGEYPIYELYLEEEKNGRIEKILLAELVADQVKYKTEVVQDFVKLNSQGHDLFDNDTIPPGGGVLNFRVNNVLYPPNATALVNGFGSVKITADGKLFMKNSPGLISQVPMEYTAGNKYQRGTAPIEIFDLNVEGGGGGSEGETEQEEELIIINVDIQSGVEKVGYLQDYISIVGINMESISDGLLFNTVNTYPNGTVEIYSNGLFRVNLTQTDFWYIFTDSEFTIELNFIVPSVANPPLKFFTLSDIPVKLPLNSKLRAYVDGVKVTSSLYPIEFLEQEFYEGVVSRTSNQLVFNPKKSIGAPINDIQYYEGKIAGDLVLYSKGVRSLIDFRVSLGREPRTGKPPGFSLVRRTTQDDKFDRLLESQSSIYVDKVFINNQAYSTSEFTMPNGGKYALVPIRDQRNNSLLGNLIVHKNSMGLGYTPISKGTHPKSARFRFFIEHYGFKDYTINLFFSQKLLDEGFPPVDPNTGLNDTEEFLSDELREDEPSTLSPLPTYDFIPTNKESFSFYCPTDTNWDNYDITKYPNWFVPEANKNLKGSFFDIDYTFVDGTDYSLDIKYCSIADNLLRPIDYEPVLLENNSTFCSLSANEYFDFPIPFSLLETNTRFCPVEVSEYLTLPPYPVILDSNSRYCPVDLVEYYAVPNWIVLAESSVNYCPFSETEWYSITQNPPLLLVESDSFYCPFSETEWYSITQNPPLLLVESDSFYCPLISESDYFIPLNTNPNYDRINSCSQDIGNYYTVDYAVTNQFDRINSCSQDIGNYYTVDYAVTNQFDRINSCSQDIGNYYTVDYVITVSYDEVGSCVQSIGNYNNIDFSSTPEYSEVNYCEQDELNYYNIDFSSTPEYSEVNYCEQDESNYYNIDFSSTPEYSEVNYCEQDELNYYDFNQAP